MNKMGRPRHELDLSELEKLSVLNPTHAEIAAYFSVSLKTVKRRLKEKKYADACSRGNSMRLVSLKRAQWDVAINNKNTSMLIWLGKNELGQRDTPALENEGEHTTKIAGAVAAAVGTMQLMIKNESEDADGPVEST